jgi:hypothetical protein
MHFKDMSLVCLYEPRCTVSVYAFEYVVKVNLHLYKLEEAPYAAIIGITIIVIDIDVHLLLLIFHARKVLSEY